MICAVLGFESWFFAAQVQRLTPRYQGDWLTALGRIAKTLIALALAGSGLVTLLLGALGMREYRVLTPTGPDGCSVVVSRNSGWSDIQGNFYVHSPGHLRLTRTGNSWSYRHATPGARDDLAGWTVQWEGSTARVDHVSAGQGGFSIEGGSTITCSRPSFFWDH